MFILISLSQNAKTGIVLEKNWRKTEKLVFFLCIVLSIHILCATTACSVSMALDLILSLLQRLLWG